MAIKIIWSREATTTYDQNIKYLLKEWSAKEVDRFLKQTDYILSRLQEYPESFSPSLKNRKVRKARLNKHITLYYQYLVRSGQIVLLSFWDVRQDPSKINY